MRHPKSAGCNRVPLSKPALYVGAGLLGVATGALLLAGASPMGIGVCAGLAVVFLVCALLRK